MEKNKIIKMLAFVILVLGTSSLDYDNFLSTDNIPFWLIAISASVIIYIAKKN